MPIILNYSASTKRNDKEAVRKSSDRPIYSDVETHSGTSLIEKIK
jgi:hypothetical protein